MFKLNKITVFLINFIPYFVVGFTGFMLGGWLAWHTKNHEAIEAGVGLWTIDERSGVKQFVYVKPQGPEEHQKAAITAGVARWVIDAKTGERSFVFVQPDLEKNDKTKGLSVTIP